jgi:hypothetical protein
MATQNVEDRATISGRHIHGEAPDVKEGADKSAPNTPVLTPRTRLPTTHDPTVKPPWKKHKTHLEPPTPDWALLWPRPASWHCPQTAGIISGYEGCRYIGAPEVFDPEIEKMPDWMGPKENEMRLWSGMDRVVQPEPAVEVKSGGEWPAKAGIGRRKLAVKVQDATEGVDQGNMEALKVVLQVHPQPAESHREQLSSIPGEGNHADKGYPVWNIVLCSILPFILFGMFICACWYWNKKMERDEFERKRERDEARKRAKWAATKRTEETEATVTSDEVSMRSLEEAAWQGKDERRREYYWEAV